jgi:flagellar protein FliL
MNKVMGILNIATKVMMFVVCTAVAAISLTTAYILFAPDEFPKPFRLVYNLTGTPSTVAISSMGENTGESNSNGESSESGGNEAAPAESTTPVPGAGVMFNMSTKIINLADPSGRKYIRLTVVLEFQMPETDPNAKKTSSGEGETVTPEQEFQNELTTLTPVMDDAVITLLSTKTYEQLYTAEGKEGLRTELLSAIQSRLPEYKLISIYFTEFVVQ